MRHTNFYHTSYKRKYHDIYIQRGEEKMDKACMSPSEHAKELLVDVMRDIVNQFNSQMAKDVVSLSEVNISKIEAAVDYMMAELSAQ